MSFFILIWGIKMNEIVNKFLLVWDKYMSEMHLRQPGFTYSACGPFTKGSKNLKKQEIQDLSKRIR